MTSQNARLILLFIGVAVSAYIAWWFCGWIRAAFSNDRHKQSSLARLVVGILDLAFATSLLWHPKETTQIGPWTAFVIAVINVVCWSDILTEKRSGSVIAAIAGNLSFAGVVSRLSALLPGKPAAVAVAEAGPAPEIGAPAAVAVATASPVPAEQPDLAEQAG